MKKQFFTSLSLLFSISVVLGQNHAFPSEISENFPSVETNSTSLFLATVDPSVYPDQDDNFIEVTSVSSGDWIDPTIWDCNCVPNSLNSVTIEDGHEVAVGFSLVTNTLHIRPNGILTMPQGMGLTLEVKRDLAVYGSLILGGVELLMNSSTPQQLLGNVSPSIMRCEGVNEITNNGNLFIKNEFWVGAAQFFTNDNMFLNNTEAISVEIAPVIFGAIHGKMAISNEIQLLDEGWLSLGNPSSNATVQTFVDDFTTTGFPGSDFPNFNFPSVLNYVEGSNSPATDFTIVSGADMPIVPGLGFYLYALAGDYVYNHFGDINVGEVNIPVDFTDHNNPSEDGLNLVANPYPATINWDSEEGWQKENMSQVIYQWDGSVGQFRTYMNGIGINGGTSLIKPMEAYWVVASGENPEAIMNEKAKAVFDDTPITPSEFMEITLTNGTWSDQLIITSGENAQTDFSSTYDAFKFDGINLVPNISCKSSDGVNLAINDTPLLDEATTISLFIDIREVGDYTISLEGVTNYVKNQCISIEDLVTGEIYDLRTITDFTFNSGIVNDQERFVIQVGDPIVATANSIACHDESTGVINAAGSGGGPWDYTWFDADMNMVDQTLAEPGAFTITDLPAGEYTVQVDSNDFCQTLTIHAEITEPEEELVIVEFVNNIPCLENANGEIALEISGGVQPYFVEWDNDELGANIDFLLAGDYSYVLTDAAGCERSGTETVTEAVDVFVAFSTEEEMVMLDENNQAVVNFTNESVGANSYTWTFEDIEESDEENPTYIFTEPGSYIVSLYATNGNCDDFEQMVIIVEQHINVEEQQLGDQVNIVVEDNAVVISSNGTLGSDQLEFVIYDLLGKVVSSSSGSFAETKEVKLSLDEANALYVVSVVNSSTGQEFRRKISRF